MSAQPAEASPRWLAMGVRDLPEVLAIEQRVYPFPWTRGNFEDSLASGNLAQLLRGRPGELLGYLVALQGVDEMHLLNITVHPDHHGRGHARSMLAALADSCRARALQQIWLEVRRSNARARAVYARYGFSEVGLRRAYYPAESGLREDAILMSLDLAEPQA
jgi:ribosomal-protein-alanine N-acetyltransferase